tara:strand:- start:264 stop:482 length:219 start_codon:yes stop_codon:yes gene_type:complete
MTLKTCGLIYFFKKRKGEQMPTAKEMAEAHLVNVENQIQQLQQQQATVDAEIARLTAYLEEGAKELNDPADC